MKLLIIFLIKLCSYSTHTTTFLIAETAVTEKRRAAGILKVRFHIDTQDHFKKAGRNSGCVPLSLLT